MRLRNVKNKEEILNNCPFLIKDPKTHRGSFEDIFQNDHPIYIEIGMGKGDFLVENAKRYPMINFIGIEKFDSVLVKAIPKLEGLKNIRVIRMDATEIESVFEREVSYLYLNFSDPWPKARHAFRRLTSPLFLARYDSIFKEEKMLEMKTDNEALFIYSLETLSQYGYGLSEVSFDYHKEKEDIIMSEYEKRFTSRGDKVYHLFAKKR